MANLKWLLNNVGWSADTVSTRVGSVASGYDIKNLITGPRSNVVKSVADTANALCPQFFVDDATTAPTKFLEASHVVMTRFDRMVNHRYASDEMRFIVAQYESGVGYNNKLNYNQVGDTSWTLMGPKQQDMVFEFESFVEVRPEFEVSISHGAGSTSWAAMFSNVAFCNPFDPGVAPSLEPRPQWVKLPDGYEYSPIKNIRPLSCEARITLSWLGISNAKRDLLQEYYTEELVTSWPLFLYDESKTLWKHQLEHVIVERDSFVWSKRGDGLNDLTCNFLRLKHYE